MSERCRKHALTSCDECHAPSADATAGERHILRVAQEDPKGCAVACLAMVSGRSYADVKASLAHPAEVECGLSDHTIVWWLQNEGYFIRRSWPEGVHGKPIPTAGVAIALTHNEHWIVLRNGHPIDPSRDMPLAFYPIRQVIEVRSEQADAKGDIERYRFALRMCRVMLTQIAECADDIDIGKAERLAEISGWAHGLLSDLREAPDWEAVGDSAP